MMFKNNRNRVRSAFTHKGLHVRLRFVQSLMVVFFGIIGLRLALIQILETEKYRSIAQRQYQSKITLPATRGSLFDRYGNSIAANTMYVSFAADPQLAGNDARAIAASFSELFGKPKQFYLNRLE